MDNTEAEIFRRLKEENAKLVKWWEHLDENPKVIDRRGTYNPLTGEIEE